MQHGESKEEGQESCEEEEVTAFELSAGERAKAPRSPIRISLEVHDVPAKAGTFVSSRRGARVSHRTLA
jgi:hypothetical protein